MLVKGGLKNLRKEVAYNVVRLKAVVEEMSSEEEEGRKDISSSLICKICAKWCEVQSFMERYYIASHNIRVGKELAFQTITSLPLSFLINFHIHRLSSLQVR